MYHVIVIHQTFTITSFHGPSSTYLARNLYAHFVIPSRHSSSLAVSTILHLKAELGNFHSYPIRQATLTVSRAEISTEIIVLVDVEG